MHPEAENRLARLANLGVDRGMRLKLEWLSGFAVTVHSWEAATVITGQTLNKRKNSLRKASAFRQNFYSGAYLDGVECLNPDTNVYELCLLTVLHTAKTGAPVNPVVQARKKTELEAKIRRYQARIVEMEVILATL